MTLRSLAQELTEPHLTMIGGRIGKAPGLLTELREAVSGSTSGDGGGSASKVGILVNASALDLLNAIEVEVRSSFADRYGQGAPTLEKCIELIGEGEHPTEWQEYFAGRFTGYRDQINGLLRPKKMRRLDGVICPSCGLSMFGEERSTCLYLDCYLNEDKELKHISEWQVHCQSCNATWVHGDMQWLLVALGQ